MSQTIPGREPFLSAAQTLLDESGCTVRGWRSTSSGRAYTSADDWGIVVPEPRGPVSYGTFAHEVGHQMLHRHGSRPRWLEELEAWEFALATFARLGLPGVEMSSADAARAMRYAFAKALRRSRHREDLRKTMIGRAPRWALPMVAEAWQDSTPRLVVAAGRATSGVGDILIPDGDAHAEVVVVEGAAR